jgi:uncharacterized membrane protein YfcA
LPVFALFFPVTVAVASTAIVHAANNLFKLLLLRRHVRGGVVLHFGLPAVGAAFVGAALLGGLAAREPMLTWSLGGRAAEVTPVKLVLGILIVGFAVVELAPGLATPRVSPRWLPVGGLISGFFGGLSGHQGAFRAAFLAPLGLSPSEFAATQAVLACLVDAARLGVYGVGFALASGSLIQGTVHWPLVAFASACAFAGAVLGRRLLPSVTLRGLRRVTGALLLVVGFALATGLA